MIAQDVLLNKKNVQDLFDDEKQLIPEEDQDCGGLLKQLEITVGMRVMLLRNLDVSLGLVNRAMGTITMIEVPHNKTQSADAFPHFVTVNLDKMTVAAEQNADYTYEIHPSCNKVFWTQKFCLGMNPVTT